jgi:GTP-binding protein
VRENLDEVTSSFLELGVRLFPVSAATGEGIPALLDEIALRLWGNASEEP